jgi:membrane-bound serine protease (ClpP class)
MVGDGEKLGRVEQMKEKRRAWVRLLLWLAWIVSATTGAVAQEGAAAHVDVLEIEGPVTPVMISYIERGIQTAEENGAEALIIQLDTPGGQVDLMGEVVRTILDAGVPVVVYVWPPGAYAASAGTVITLAGHVAAMAPGTTIGAASPVGSQGEDLGETMESKLKEDLKAQVRALTERRGEEAVAWAESAIEEAKAATAREALEMNVIDFVAEDLQDLLAQMDGHQVTVRGEEMTLETADARTEDLPMNFIEQVLHTITNPTIAFLLLSLGPTAILFELSSPGGYVAGIVGVICLLLGFYAVGVLPVNYAGLLFMALAFVLFIADLKAPSHGALTIGGIASLIVGGLMLFNSPLYRVSLTAIISVAVTAGLFFGFAVTKVVQAHRRPAVTGREGLIGQLAQARSALDPEGTVFLKGELWVATAIDGPVERGETVEIVTVEGFHLQVRRAPDAATG